MTTIEWLAKMELRRKEEWLNRAIKPHVPPCIHRCAEKRQALPFIMNWLAKNKFHLAEHPDATLLMQGDRILSAYQSLAQKISS